MNKATIDGIIFDMDGVLIDVRKSCRLTVLNTVNYFSSFTKERRKATKSEVNAIKSIPGFNNDWDASVVLINLLKKGIDEKMFWKFAKPLSKKEKQTEKYKRIREIWQTFYLGSDNFEKSEKKKAPFLNKNPYRFQEKLIVKKKTLVDLKKMFRNFAIATSRPREEAIFALNQFGLSNFFEEQCLIALEDVTREKPDPEPLLKAKNTMSSRYPLYIGDTINDVIAAQKARIPCVFVGRDRLGDCQIKSVNDILSVLNDFN